MIAGIGCSSVVSVGRCGDREFARLDPVVKLWYEGEGEGDDGAYIGGGEPATVDIESLA